MSGRPNNKTKSSPVKKEEKSVERVQEEGTSEANVVQVVMNVTGDAGPSKKRTRSGVSKESSKTTKPRRKRKSLPVFESDIKTYDLWEFE
jgi:hypothetical protein